MRIFFIFTFLLSLISILRPGLINVDFADVRTIMGDAGTALMGIGRGSGMARMFLIRVVFLGIFFFFYFFVKFGGNSNTFYFYFILKFLLIFADYHKIFHRTLTSNSRL